MSLRWHGHLAHRARALENFYVGPTPTPLKGDHMIPKLIHQTARTSDLPKDCRPYVEKLRALHPDWTYRLWTDEDNLAFVRREFSEFAEIFTKLPRNIMRADVIRYLLMYRLGGLYVDTDYEMIKPFDLTDRDIVLCWEGDPRSGEGKFLVANSIFASSPGHAFFKMIIDELRGNPPLATDADVEAGTGPGLVTRVYQSAVKAGLDPYTAPALEFNPLTPRNGRQYRAILNNGVSYGIHHCHGSWRHFTAGQRLKMSLSRMVHKFI
jgi:mannosyltransferase OCH1-like enzyme